MYSLIPAFYAAEQRGIDPQRLKVPEEVKSLPDVSPSKLILLKLASGERPSDSEIENAVRDLGVRKEQLVDLLDRIIVEEGL